MEGVGVRQLSCLPAKTTRASKVYYRSGDPWLDGVRLCDIEHRFVCEVCGKRGADVRPDFNWNKRPGAVMGYR